MPKDCTFAQMQQRILTGIQSSGAPHLGNLLGAIFPAIDFAEQTDKQCFYFIADLHSLTTVHQSAIRPKHTLSVAAAWLACGLDTDRHIFYRQSRLPQVCELSWYLSCFTPYPMLANSHAFKDRSDQLSEVNAGLFTYPVLMAADILLYRAHQVPVGKDQQQHLEMARDIASSFNHRYGDVFVIPEAVLSPAATQAIPGTDGRKMSKSYGNTIDIFLPEEELRKQVMRIQTDSQPLKAPKDPNKCLVYALYAIMSSFSEAQEMSRRYRAGGYGYGDAKEALLAQLLRRFSAQRHVYADYLQHPQKIEEKLQAGEAQAATLAEVTLQKVRQALGFS